ncbi:MAG: YvcK family protein [Candidatus Aenigmarchaeota archaeon]|nr:YvcK family protein [Candidatus Aenigmarchaeota archaeon]
MIKILCFGGGSGLPEVVLEPLKKYDEFSISSVTSMVDNGGSTGQLRRDFNVLPPGDIRRHILALSEAEDWKKKLWKFRFGHEEFPGGHKGHSFANVFIAGLEYVTKDYEKALEIVHDFMRVKGRCLPATTDQVQLIVKLENGEEAVGEDEIDVPKNHDANLKISEVFLRPEGNTYPPVIVAIKEADVIIIGPGDLYSSLVPCFLPKGIKEAIQESKAVKIFICPAMTKLGETQGFDVEKFAGEMERYIGCELDYVLFNNQDPDEGRIKKFKEENPHLLQIVPFEGVSGEKFVGRDLLLDGGPILYDPVKVEKVLVELIRK